MSRLLGLIAGMLLVCGGFWFCIQKQGNGHGLSQPKEMLTPFVEKISSRLTKESTSQAVTREPTDSAREEVSGIEGAGSNPAPAWKNDPASVSGEEAVAFPPDQSGAGPPTAGGALPDRDPGKKVDAESPAPVKTAWQAFWTPFRTKKSAKGFASRIHDLTGLTLDVQEKGPGKYRVCFAYTDEDDRQHHMKLIEEKTRLSIFQGESI